MPRFFRYCAKFLSVCQRSEIESKSQLKLSRANGQVRFYQSVKDQKLKANHNRTVMPTPLVSVFISLSKIKMPMHWQKANHNRLAML